MYFFYFFFFSSRRRHTRWTGDWSSDVCSSDLLRGGSSSERAVAVQCEHLGAIIGAREVDVLLAPGVFPVRGVAIHSSDGRRRQFLYNFIDVGGRLVSAGTGDGIVVAQILRIEHIDAPLLARADDAAHAGNEQCASRTQVRVFVLQTLLIEGREVVLHLEAGVEPDEAITVVCSTCIGVEITIAADIVDVAAAIGGESAACAPDAAARPGRGGVVDRGLCEL